jgi:quercetin dioxygenase-like cupin family protein
MKHIERRKLKVEDAFHDDIYKDIVRIHWQERGKRNRIGAIVGISVDGSTPRFFSLRGLSNKYKGEIRFDHVTRDELRLRTGDVHDFAIKETNPWQKLLWAVRATDPAARIAACIAAWSVFIGILALVLAGIGVIPVIRDWMTAPKTEQRTAHYSAAPDPVKTSPQYYKILLENDQVRVLEYRLKPGEKEPMHSHPAGIVYVLSDATLNFTYADGKTEDRTAVTGQTIWRGPVTHAVENTGETEARTIAIDLKK